MASTHQMGVVALLKALHAGKVSAAGLTDLYLDRISRLDPKLSAFEQVDADRARQAAADSEARYAAGNPRPLEGVPIAIKSNIAVSGLPHTSGIKANFSNIAQQDSSVVARLRQAGAVILGTLNMHEGALGATTDNPFFGQTQNPHKIGYSAGGSSGGAGAAVAAGLCAAAVGTDTMGSVRIPASWCGIFGFKPTPNVILTDGVSPLVPEWDTVGLLTRAPEDLGLLLGIVGTPEAAPNLAEIAVLDFANGPDLNRSVSAALRLASSMLKGLGYQVAERRAHAPHKAIRLASFISCALGAKASYAEKLAIDSAGFSENFHDAIAFASTHEAADQTALVAGADALQAALRMDDLLLLPTTPQPAMQHGNPVPESVVDFTGLANLAGLSAVSIPAGWTSEGLPVGVQLVGRAGEDLAVLQVAQALAGALNAWAPPPEFA